MYLSDYCYIFLNFSLGIFGVSYPGYNNGVVLLA